MLARLFAVRLLHLVERLLDGALDSAARHRGAGDGIGLSLVVHHVGAARALDRKSVCRERVF